MEISWGSKKWRQMLWKLKETLLFNIRANHTYLNQTKMWDSSPTRGQEYYQAGMSRINNGDAYRPNRQLLWGCHFESVWTGWGGVGLGSQVGNRKLRISELCVVRGTRRVHTKLVFKMDTKWHWEVHHIWPVPAMPHEPLALRLRGGRWWSLPGTGVSPWIGVFSPSWDLCGIFVQNKRTAGWGGNQLKINFAESYFCRWQKNLADKAKLHSFANGRPFMLFKKRINRLAISKFWVLYKHLLI